MVYLITYELNKPDKDYQSLYAALQNYEFIRDVNLDSVWFINSSATAEQISEYIRQHMDDSDRLFVTKLQSGGYDGWMHQNVWDWIRLRL